MHDNVDILKLRFNKSLLFLDVGVGELNKFYFVLGR